MTRGTLYYDGTCSLCVGAAKRMRPLLTSRRIRLSPFPNGTAEKEMKLAWRDGRKLGGADAAFLLCSLFWWTWPIWLLSKIPGVAPASRAGYRRVAAARHCSNGACRLSRR